MGITQRDLFPERPAASNGEPRQSTAKPTVKPSPNAKPARDTTPTRKHFATATAAVAALSRMMKPTHGPPAGQWTYHDASGKPVAWVLRFNVADGSKEFRPVSLHGDAWFLKGPATPRPLYGLPDLATAATNSDCEMSRCNGDNIGTRDVTTAATVYVCEGEKTADAARSIGLVAVTSMNGSKSPDKTDWTPLAGKAVVILRDNDEPGRMYADAVATILTKLSLAPVVKIVELPGLPPKGDFVEWIEAHGGAAEPDAMRRELQALVDAAVAIEPERPEPLVDRFEPFPVDALPEPVRSFVVAGAKSPGCDESFIALPVLTMLAASIGNTRRLFVKRGWTEPPILWTVIVGNSGSFKSPAIELALKPVKDRQRDAFRLYADAMNQHRAEELAHGKALDVWKRSKTGGEPPTSPAEPVADRYLADDTTIESRAGLLRNQRRASP